MSIAQVRFVIAVDDLAHLANSPTAQFFAAGLDALVDYFQRQNGDNSVDAHSTLTRLTSPDGCCALYPDKTLSYLAEALQLTRRRKDGYARNIVDIAAPGLPHMQQLKDVCNLMQESEITALLSDPQRRAVAAIATALEKISSTYASLSPAEKGDISQKTTVIGFGGTRIVRPCSGYRWNNAGTDDRRYQGDVIIELGIDTLPRFLTENNVLNQYYSDNEGSVDIRVIMRSGEVKAFNFKQQGKPAHGEALVPQDISHEQVPDYINGHWHEWVENFPPCVKESARTRGDAVAVKG